MNIIDKINEQVLPFDYTIESQQKALYWAVVSALVALLNHMGGSLDIQLLYRYIDADNEQSLYKVNRVYIEDGKLWINNARDNGESRAADVHFDDTEDFDDNAPYCLSDSENPSSFDLEFIQSIYTEVRYYALPRLLMDPEAKKALARS